MKRLGILLVTHSYHPIHGGIGEHVRHLGLALQARGHRVAVIAPGPEPPLGELPDLRVIRAGVRVRVPSNGSRATVALPPIGGKILKREIGFAPDLIHIHSPLEPFLPWRILREATVPCVGTFHNSGRPHWGYRWFAPLLSDLMERLAVRVAVSRCAAEYVGRHFPGTYRVVPNGVDPARFSPGDRDRRRNGHPTLLFVGSLEPRKGLDVLVDGVALASSRMDLKPRLLVVGDGSRRGRLLRRAQRRGVDLRWLGAPEPAQLPACYREADLLIAPALHGEAFGVVLLEALASGLPVVASRIEGYAELLRACPAAHLIPPGDPDSLADRIRFGWERSRDPVLCGAGRRFALTFSWDRVAAAMEGIYAEVAGGPPAAVDQVIVPPRPPGRAFRPRPQNGRNS